MTTFNNLEAIAEFTGQTVTTLRAQRKRRRDEGYGNEAGDSATWQLKQLGAKRLMFVAHPRTAPIWSGGLAFDEEDIPANAHWLVGARRG